MLLIVIGKLAKVSEPCRRNELCRRAADYKPNFLLQLQGSLRMNDEVGRHIDMDQEAHLILAARLTKEREWRVGPLFN
jgi:hypothetical protein